MTFRAPWPTRAAAVLVIVLAAGSSACSSVRDTVVTEPSLDAVTSRVTQSSLSVEDKRLFMVFAGRAAAAQSLGRWSDEKAAYDGKTVAAIIEEERSRQSSADAGDAQRSASAALATAEAAALAAAIGKSLSVAVLETRTAQFGVLPYSYLKLAAENISGKEIAAFSGRLTIRDMFGDEVGHAAVDVTEPIKSGVRVTWEELVSDVAAGKMATKHLKFQWTPEQVTFQDGSQLGPVKPAAR